MIRRIIYSNPPILVSLPFFIALPLIVFFFSSSSSPFHISRVPSKRVTIFLFFFLYGKEKYRIASYAFYALRSFIMKEK